MTQRALVQGQSFSPLDFLLDIPDNALVMESKAEQFDASMRQLGQRLDNHLEDTFGGNYSLHPCRMERGKGANPAYDGLFATTIAFTPGYGSQYGRGYVVNIDIRTLDHVEKEDRIRIAQDAFHFLGLEIPEVFPERSLEIVQDGNELKIIGDLSLN